MFCSTACVSIAAAVALPWMTATGIGVDLTAVVLVAILAAVLLFLPALFVPSFFIMCCSCCIKAKESQQCNDVVKLKQNSFTIFVSLKTFIVSVRNRAAHWK